jgi:spore germination cell wall hydrolase CwlJ-like protein
MLATALTCMALTIYHESRSEPIAGQYAVASVVMNRMSKGKLDTCDVITTPNQFTWVRSSKLKASKEGHTIPEKHIPKGKLWDTALEVARKVLIDNEGIIPNIRFFHATHVNPKWKYKFVMKLGNHKFYS